jgi:Fe2+ or Zn2+ uptake regulation protein
MATFQQRAVIALRARGGRITPQRELLLDLLAGADADIDADSLHQLASDADPNISLPTVYRTLNTLEDAEIITSQYVSREHERKVYHISDDKEDIFHFTCRQCGRVTAVQSVMIGQLKREISIKLGAEVSSVCMCAGGLCADCRAANEENEA